MGKFSSFAVGIYPFQEQIFFPQIGYVIIWGKINIFFSLLCWVWNLFQDIVCASVDVDMPKVDEGLTDPFETIFAKRGEVQKRSGSKKLVSFIFISWWQFIIEFCVGNTGWMNAHSIPSQSPEYINGENDRQTGRKLF